MLLTHALTLLRIVCLAQQEATVILELLLRPVQRVTTALKAQSLSISIHAQPASMETHKDSTMWSSAEDAELDTTVHRQE